MTLHCDFCGSTQIRWTYPCRDFSMFGLFGLLNTGPWAACNECHFLIEANEHEALALRSNNTLRAKLPIMPDDTTGMRKIHDMFRQHRTGPAIPHQPGKDI